MLASHPSLKEALGKITFRDALLGVEGLRQSVGGRSFLPMPGMTRDIAALQIVRQFGINRVSTFEEEPREVLLKRMAPEDAELPDLLLQTPIHSIFGRDHCPVSFLLDIDAKHELPEETKNWKTFEDRVLGLVLFACRKAFVKHQLVPKKVCILTAGDGTKPFASLHLHIDFQNTVFHDSTSIANFIRGALTNEIEAMANSSAATKSGDANSHQSISKFARRVIRAIDAQPFGTVGGSLRLYGAPKTDGTRPCRLFHPVSGGAAASALLALSPTHGGPTIELMKFARTNNKNLQDQEEKSHMKLTQIRLNEMHPDIDLSTILVDQNSTSPEIIESISKFNVLHQQRILANMSRNSNTNTNNNLVPEIDQVLVGLHGVPVIRRIELDALAMSLGTPDWLAPEPFRFVSFQSPAFASSTTFFANQKEKERQQQQQDSSSEKTDETSPKKTQSQQPKCQFNPQYPGAHICLNTSGDFNDFPQIIRNDISRTLNSKNPFPYPNHEKKCNPMTYCYLARKIVPLIPDCFAVPYKTWVSICLGVSDIAAFTKKRAEMRLQELRSRSNPSDEVKAEIDFLENHAIDPIAAMEEAFLEFSNKSPSNFNATECKQLYRKMVNRKLRDVSGKSAVTDATAPAAYRTLINYFRKSPP